MESGIQDEKRTFASYHFTSNMRCLVQLSCGENKVFPEAQLQVQVYEESSLYGQRSAKILAHVTPK